MSSFGTIVSERDRYITVDNVVYELIVSNDESNYHNGFSCSGCYFENSNGRCDLDGISIFDKKCNNVYNGIYVKSIIMNRLKKLNDIFDKQLKFPWYE